MVSRFGNKITLILKPLFYSILEFPRIEMNICKDIVDAFDYCFVASLLWCNKYISDELGLGLL